ncbi:MAG: AMP-binding protein [Pseudomonadota bacterium]
MNETKPPSAEPTGDARAAIEHRVLSLVEALARELNPGRRLTATLDASLQRDLGFDSLGLSELLLRTEKEFGIRLADDLIAEIDTPQDLANEIAQSGQGVIDPVAQKTETLPSAMLEAVPDTVTTLIGVLEWRTRQSPDRTHILLSDGYNESETITYGALSEAAGRFAAGLRSWGLEPGERVGIMLPTGNEFFEAFFGVLLAGGVPAPMYPPIRLSQLEEHLRRQAGILRNSEAALLIVPQQGKTLTGLLGGQIDTLRGVSTVAALRASEGPGPAIDRQPDDLAMLQYTSGSTGDPKGVMLTHANLLANIRAMGRAIDATSNDVFVSWLPLYHDLGLIGAWFGSLYYGVPAVIMSPLHFIVRPESWLWAIHRNSATLTAAPNFAFELCVDKIDDAAIAGLDLSSLRMVANGAEPISVDTIRRFTERFEPYGFRPQAMTPVYGLAESSVGLAFSSAEQLPIVERIDRAALSQTGKAVPARPDDAHAMPVVSSGVPLPGHEVRIVDAIGQEAPGRQEGRLEFRGPSSTRGYFRDPERTEGLIRGDWLTSGDLAYIANGNIFLTGRVKDLIIKGGRNIYPQEIENGVGALAGIRKGCVAAFASTDARTGTERLVVVAESRETDPSRRADLQDTVARSVSDILGMPADEVVIVKPHAVPKTSSGKIRRSTARELYEAGNLGQETRALWMQILRLGLMSGASRARRLLATSADLAYAGWWWSVLVLLGAVVWPSVLLLPNRRWRWGFVRSAARTALRLMGIRFSVSGVDRLATDRAIVVANHSSYTDALVMAALLPDEPAFVAKKELAGQFVAGPFLRRLRTHFAERADFQEGLQEVEAFKAFVARGNKLVFFPEATFFRMPGLLPFRLGAFTVACAADAPVVPVVIRGTRSILRGEQWFPRRGAVEIEVLEPLTPGGADFAAAIDLRDRTRAQILAHCGEPDAAARTVSFQKDGVEVADG